MDLFVGILDENQNLVKDPGEKKVYFEFSDYSTSYTSKGHTDKNVRLFMVNQMALFSHCLEKKEECPR